MSLLVMLCAVAGISAIVASVKAPHAWSMSMPTITRRSQTIDVQVWPDVVDDVASAIRAGLSLPQAVIELSRAQDPTIASAFLPVAQRFESSGHFVSSLEMLNENSHDIIASKFVSALTIAYEVGGSDLGIMLRTLSEVVRDEVKLRGEVKARQSWTVNGARMAVAAPWLTVALLSTRSDAARVYQSASGIRMLLLCAVVSAVAYVVMKRIGTLPEGVI